MPRIILRSVAEAEVTEALDWYAGRSHEAARAFLETLDQTLDRIQQAPESFPVVQGRVRRALLPHFPYGVYFRVFPDLITVVGVVHGKRHPRRWLRKT